ncbi:MAG: cytochrome c1 [Alphaproteobacteria bacterium]|nr:cytochrome c1 [Alphaproteobacteria bacterium]
MWIAASLALLAVTTLEAHASSDQKHPKQVKWSFDGVLGRVDKPSAQRGLQVYKEVCAACHGLSRVAFRSLADLGFSEGEIKALAKDYSVKDGPNDEGEMFERPGLPSDKFVPPYPNENAARAANNGAYPPDLSLIIKARPDGANYLYSLLTGYEEPPADMQLPDGQHYNPYFPGHKLAMPAPLSDGQVTYEDGTEASLDQMSKDVVNFLQWTAEPEMEHRKQMGIKVLLYLLVFTAFAYVAKKHIWRKLH